MAALRRVAAHYHVWLKVAGILLVLNALVQWVFVPTALRAYYATPFPMLRDRTLGSNLAVLFALLPEPAPPGDLVVVVVGDSTVGAGFPAQAVPYWLERQLQARFPDRHVRVIDFSVVGLYTSDALLFIAKAFSFSPDLVVYALSPRTVPTDPPTPWATAVDDLALEPDIVRRVGLGTILPMLDPQSLGRTLVYSTFPLVRLRVEIAHALLRAAGKQLPGAAGRWAIEQAGGAKDIRPNERWDFMAGGYQWPKDKYRLDPPTPRTRALDAVADLCRREGRCLLYHIPVNPGGVRGLEPGLTDDFVAYLRAQTEPRGVPFLDFRNRIEASLFRINNVGLPDGIHLTADGHRAFAPILADAVAARLRELGR